MANTALDGISRYTFGTMSLGGDNLSSFADDVKVARAAMDAGVWFHTCNGYANGDTFAVLRRAFEEDRAHVPPTIFKCRRDNLAAFEYDIESSLRGLGLDTLSCVQVCGSAQSYFKVPQALINDCGGQGPLWESMQQHRQSGKVQSFVLEMFSSNSWSLLDLVKQDLFDGYIFYYNPFEREACDETFDAMRATGKPILSLRTLGAISRRRLPDQLERPESMTPQFSVQLRERMLAPLLERASISDWVEFSYAFLFSQPEVATTIGGTRTMRHLEHFIVSAERAAPLSGALRDEVLALHSLWFGQPAQAEG